jgi:hypothetical protein
MIFYVPKLFDLLEQLLWSDWPMTDTMMTPIAIAAAAFL